MKIRWTAIFLSLLFTVSLCPGGAFAGSSYQAPRPTSRPTFNNASGFKPSGSPTSRTVVRTPAPSRPTQQFNNASGFKPSGSQTSRTVVKTPVPRTGTSANPMARGGKVTNEFNAKAQGKDGKKQDPVVLGGGKGGVKVLTPGENQVQKPPGLTATSKPPKPLTR